MQSNRQQAYDRGVTVFSPDGRLYQVEYAREAVKRGSPSVGVTTDDAVVFATRGRPRSPLMDADSIEKLHDVDGHLGVATAGHVADGRSLVDFARQYAQRERLRYGERPGVEPLAKAVADHIQDSTQTGGSRPFGAALLAGGVDDGGPALYEVDPSGTPGAWRATAVGSDSDGIRTYLEDEYAPELTVDEGVRLALRALASETDEDLAARELDVAVMTADGFDSFDGDRRESAIADAERSAS